MNDPFNNDRAECKLVQLRKAAEIGLEVPKTIVTNSANEVSDFRKQSRKGTVVKAVYAPLIESENAFVFTHLLSGDDTPSDEEAALAPFICQEALIPKDDIRVTVVGDRAFAARLYRNEQLPVDWRQSSHELPWEPVTLPDELSRRLVALVEALGLVFAGIDLIHHLGTYYFVEANPNGEWGWLQTGTGLPIASAIVDTITAWS
ncbi:MAG: hypothetical protein KGJ62_01585 [Armatimonadetes bacterium]|nr:hypothetical protein [Armatimonadota bacterium]MDE2205472.1 hypothetical protein [Armatimonadota bacterium]